MPGLIEHIDAIARKRQRDVLYLSFVMPADAGRKGYQTLEIRRHILAWLDAERIEWLPCGPYASSSTLRPYAGQIFIDVPFDTGNPGYQKVQHFLEHPDGSCRFPEVIFHVLTLEFAMHNSHHDAPGFWEQWSAFF